MIYIYYGIILIVSYLVGAVPFGLIIARCAGKIDIRQKGSGNIGATNVGRVLGKKWGVFVFVLDWAKGFLPVFCSGLVLDSVIRVPAGMSRSVILVLSGALAIVGHVFPVYLSFRGGKGVATSAGVLCALAWRVPVIAFAIWAGITLISGYVSLASITAAVSAPVIFYVLNRQAAFSDDIAKTVFLIGLAVLVIIRHKSNIKRLLRGEESKVLRGNTKEE